MLRFFLFIFFVFAFAGSIQAADYQSCTTSSNCSLGEFLFNDDSTPDATASCTLTSRYPDGSVFLNSVSLTPQSNAWYSYTASIGTTEGVYPTQICCDTFDSQHLCLDKTFQVTSGSSGGGLTAAEVWNYPDRSVTSFGNLISDIWNYSSRSLTGLGNFTSTVTYTDSASNVQTAADIKNIKKVVAENRTLLESLVNKPIVKTFIDETPTPSLTEKIEQTKNHAADLYSNIQNLKSRAVILSEKWPTLTQDEIIAELKAQSTILSKDSGKKDSSVIAVTNWLKTSWNNPILLNLSEQAQAAQSKIDNLLKDLSLYNKSYTADSFAPSLSHILSLSEIVGTSLASSNDPSLFGFIKHTVDQVAIFDNQSKIALNLLTQVKSDDKADLSADISNLKANILSTNLVPQANMFFQKSIKNTDSKTNQVLGLIALVNTNKLLLASNTGQTIKTSWLEEGSIIFRSVAINPSRSLTQNVNVKFYLPTEVKKEQIISADPELKIEYDATENALYAIAEISLAPQETRTFLVEVEDIWSFQQGEIDSLKKQTTDLTESLKNTSNYSQAVSIKSDIMVTLDKIMLRQQQAITPENRIQTYRESSIEMNGIEEKIYSLKELIIQTRNTGGVAGFAGGVQVLSFWGIIIIAIAGFSFVSFYFKTIRQDTQPANQPPITSLPASAEIKKSEPRAYRHQTKPHHPMHKLSHIASVVLLVAGTSSVGISISTKVIEANKDLANPSTTKVQVLGTQSEKKYPYKAELIIPKTGSIPVRTSPITSAPEILSLKTKQTIFVFKANESWTQIGLTEKDQDKSWWVNNEFLTKP